MYTNTKEQTAILQEVLTKDEHVGVIAGAGCGKSSTARLVCNSAHQKKRKPLYIAYNRSAAEEFQFKGNIDSMTQHSFCRNLLKRVENFKTVNNYIMSDIREILHVDFQIGQDVLQTLNNYFYSAHLELNLSLVPPMERISDPMYRDMARNMVLRYTKDFLIDRKKRGIYSHDAYVKILQTDYPELLNLDYDLFTIDEFQDSNPAFLAILNRHPQQQLCIGDPMQSIYGWRGAVDAFDQFNGVSKDLSISFRFPDVIAHLANHIISQRNSSFRLTGMDSSSTFLNQTAYLHRSNIGCLLRAKELLDKGIDFVLQGGISKEEKAVLADMRCLATNHPEWIKTPHCKGMTSYEDIRDMIKQERGSFGEWSNRERLIHKLGGMSYFQNELAGMEAVSEANIKNPAAAVITTAHKAKGLEYPRIVVGSDFLSKFKTSESDYLEYGAFSIAKARIEEQNLLYVAVTRARKTVSLKEVSPLFPEFSEEVGQMA